MRLPALLAVSFSLALGGAAGAAEPTHFAAKSSPVLTAAVAARPGERQVAWVYFSDKGDAAALRAAAAQATMTPRAASRRRLRGSVRDVTFEDLALPAAYVDAVRARVTRVRQVSRWFNAVSVEATAEELRAVSALPFVARLDAVRRYRQRREPVEPEGRPSAQSVPAEELRKVLDYGTSFGQLDQIGVPAVHARGQSGQGVIIAMFDAGFSTLAHEAFAALNVIGMHDFVNGDENVGDHGDRGNGSHGMATLSVIGGYGPGQLIGPAFSASYLLAKTEDTESETPVEEDNWAAAAEWAETLGADVISSSLGYLEYDPGFPSYTFADMDGDTAISSRAADMAAERGVVVVNSAGNSGFHPDRNTLGAPADGQLVIAVGAVTNIGQRASFSSVGPTSDGRLKPDVAAQGVAVKIARAGTPSSYGLSNGTSFSCPLTAGVAALVLQANPSLTVPQVIDILRGTASQAAIPDRLLGWGIVNALAAVDAAAAAPHAE